MDVVGDEVDEKIVAIQFVMRDSSVGSGGRVPKKAHSGRVGGVDQRVALTRWQILMGCDL